jgi:hypothetical protein
MSPIKNCLALMYFVFCFFTTDVDGGCSAMNLARPSVSLVGDRKMLLITEGSACECAY